MTVCVMTILLYRNGCPYSGRDPAVNECSGVQLTCQQCDPFPRNTFTVKEAATFVAVIGPSANPRGYTAITGDQTSRITAIVHQNTF